MWQCIRTVSSQTMSHRSHMQYQSITVMFLFLRLFVEGIFPTEAIQTKSMALKGTNVQQMLFQWSSYLNKLVFLSSQLEGIQQIKQCSKGILPPSWIKLTFYQGKPLYLKMVHHRSIFNTSNTIHIKAKLPSEPCLHLHHNSCQKLTLKPSPTSNTIWQNLFLCFSRNHSMRP